MAQPWLCTCAMRGAPGCSGGRKETERACPSLPLICLTPRCSGHPKDCNFLLPSEARYKERAVFNVISTRTPGVFFKKMQMGRSPFFKKLFLFIWLHQVLAAAQQISSLPWGTQDLFFFQLLHPGSTSLTRDHTQAPCIGSPES